MTEDENVPTQKSAWRTGDMAWPTAVVAYLLASAALLALAASGSWVGMIGAGVIVSAELALLIEWASAPFDRETDRPRDLGR